MKARQFVTPVLIRNGTATVLRHVPFDERTFKEADLQALLFAHPTLIPVGDIEPIFDRLHPLARELRVGSGFIDLVFMNDEGYLTLVETKLWRNPEARRTVVAQLIDYASHVSNLDVQRVTTGGTGQPQGRCLGVRRPAGRAGGRRRRGRE